MRSRQDNNVRLRNEAHKLFKGPVYLLPLEVPLVLIGVILIMAYRAVKFTVKQSIKILKISIIYTPDLVEYIGHYLCLIFKIVFTHAQHLSTKLYRNIVEPIKLFMYNSIFPVIYNVSKRVFNAIVWFCVWFYQRIIPATFEFCYLRIIEPTSKWIIEFSIVFCSTLSLLFRKVRLVCEWMWQNILYPFWRFIFIDVLLLFYQSVVKIVSFVRIKFLSPLNRQVKKMLRIFCLQIPKLFCYLITCVTYTVVSFREACASFYKTALLPVFPLIIRIGSFVCTEFLAPLWERLKDSMRIIYYYSQQLVLHLSTCMLCAMGSLRDACASFLDHILSPLLKMILRIYIYIYSEMLKPVSRLAVYIARMFCDRLYQSVFHPLGCLLYSTGELFYRYLLPAVSSAVSTLLPVITNSFNEIWIMVSSVLNATALAMATLGTTITAIFRTDTRT